MESCSKICRIITLSVHEYSCLLQWCIFAYFNTFVSVGVQEYKIFSSAWKQTFPKCILLSNRDMTSV
jgi:hypothetical protein